MNWEDFQGSEKIGIEDPPGVTVDDDDRGRNRGKIQKNQNEQKEHEISERMDSSKDGGKANRHGETKSLMDFEKTAGEGTPPEMKEFWF